MIGCARRYIGRQEVSANQLISISGAGMRDIWRDGQATVCGAIPTI
jgi:hypothetical protein